MNNLFIDGTALTPLIDFNADQGVMRIQGRSIPDNPDEFWYKVLLWFDEYMMNSHSLTTFEIDLEYFNVTSSKRILALLYKLNDLINMNKDVWLLFMATEIKNFIQGRNEIEVCQSKTWSNILNFLYNLIIVFN